MLRTSLCALVAAALLLGCDPFGVAPDDREYNFDTSCRSQSEANACNDCCLSLGGDTSALRTGTCGCAQLVESTSVCDSATSFDECRRCCSGAGYDGVTDYTSGTGGRTCTCRRLEPIPSSSVPIDAGPRDGCTSSGQSCVCGNTGLPGMCGTGPDFSGLYCRCD